VEAGAAQEARSDRSLSREEADGGDRATSTFEARIGVDWAGVVFRIVGLQEEGIFRAIVGYL